MSHFRLALAVMALFTTQYSLAQFQKVIGTQYHDIVTSIVPDPSGNNWVITGNQLHSGSLVNSFALSINSNGVQNWYQSYNDATNNYSYIEDVLYLPNGDLYTLGTDDLFNGQDIFLMQLDPATGAVLNDAAIAHSNSGIADYGHSLIEDFNGNLAFAGRSGANSALGRINPTLANQQTISLNTGVSTIANGIEIHPTNNEYVVVGQGWSSAGNWDGVIYRLDQSGGLISTQIFDYGLGGDEVFHSIARYSGGYVVTGYTSSVGAGQRDVLFVMLDNSATVVGAVVYGGTQNDQGTGIIPTSDGGFAIVGDTWSFGHGQSDVYLIKIDASGVLQWSMVYGGTGNDVCTRQRNPLHELPTGGYMLTATTGSFNVAGGNEIYIIRTDWTGSSGCHELGALTQQLPATPPVPLVNGQVNGTLGFSPITMSANADPTDEDMLCCGTWHNTSHSNADHDEGNDIATDANENVYVVGTYDGYTNFENTSIPSSLANQGEAMFLAKYNFCGRLQWVAYSEETSTTTGATGKGIILDEANNVAYITGSYTGLNNVFTSANGLSQISMSPSGGTGLYVAAFDMTNGNVLWVHDYQNGSSSLDVSAIALDGEGELLVTGTTYGGSGAQAFLYKTDATNANYYFLTGSLGSYGTDLACTGANQRVYMTGNYESNFSFNGTGTITKAVGAIQDGFLLFLDDGTGITQPTVTKMTKSGVYGGSSYAEINGVHIDQSGFPLVVGTFNNGKLDDYFVDPVFSQTTVGANPTNEMFAARVDPNAVWGAGSWLVYSSQSSPFGTNGVFGKDINFDGSNVIIGGHHDYNFNLYFANSALTSSLTYNGNGPVNAYQVSISTAGVPQWNLNAKGDLQEVSRLAVSTQSNVFTTGHYLGTMDMTNGDIPILTNTSGGSGSNCFVVRSDATTGGFFFVDPNWTGIDDNSEDKHKLSVYPNPGTGQFQVLLDGNTNEATTISVYNDLQQQIMAESIIPNATSFWFDLSDQPAGIYFVKVQVGDHTEVRRLSIVR